MTEPPNKRAKIQKLTKLKAIMPDEYTCAIAMARVYVTMVEDKKQISKIIKELAMLLPLPQLQHLKRVKDNKIIVCDAQEFGNQQDLQAFLESKPFSHEIIGQIVKAPDVIEVPRTAPRLRWQYEQVNRIWPCKFHPDKYLESRYDGTNFTAKDRNFQFLIAELLKEISHNLLNNEALGICVDPRTNSIVAIAAALTHKNPLKHCSMMLVDNVAKSQDSGAWKDSLDIITTFEKNDSETQTSGIPKVFKDFTENNIKYNDIKLGAERIRVMDKLKSHETLSLEGDNLAKYGPYLCTGYDVYLLKEPCLMCAMALVHSRVKRVFFLKTSSNGSLLTSFKLQGVPELNHHYEVYHMQYSETESMPDNKS